MSAKGICSQLGSLLCSIPRAGFGLANRVREWCSMGGRYGAPRVRYVAVLKENPELAQRGCSRDGEIELVFNSDEIDSIERIASQRLLQKGCTAAEAFQWSRSGVICEDPWFLLIRDAVQFPSGECGLYSRFIWKRTLDGSNGAAALPVLSDGRILLNLNYRHATRQWELELPRGMANKGEKLPKQTVLRELEEETGMKCAEPQLLGTVASDTGILSSVPAIYLCPISGKGMMNRENEAIKKCIPLTVAEIAKGLRKGHIVYEGIEYPLRDSFLAFAFLQAHLQGKIQIPFDPDEEDSKSK